MMKILQNTDGSFRRFPWLMGLLVANGLLVLGLALTINGGSGRSLLIAGILASLVCLVLLSRPNPRPKGRSETEVER